MSLNDFKITPQSIENNGVVSAPDVLSGSARENKMIFDQLIREVVTAQLNGLIDKLVENGAEAILQRGDESLLYIRVNADKALEFSVDGENYEATGSSGHLIVDKNGSILPQRSRLKFADGKVWDDGENIVVEGVFTTGIKTINGVEADENGNVEVTPTGIGAATIDEVNDAIDLAIIGAIERGY